jgi:uncharacterized repeat protein (TIGR01451 family)
MQARTARRPGIGLGPIVAAGAVLAALLVGPGVDIGGAVEIPPPGGGFYFQTSGPNAGAGIGDWYSSTDAGAGSGFHYVVITVPCGWPSGTALHIDLFSPEMNQVAGATGQGDEPRGANYDFTQFQLYGPGATIGPGYDEPGPGDAPTIFQFTYPPGALPEAWVRFRTLDPDVTCGTYVLRSAVLTTAPGEGDDDNGWRLRVGTDDDGDPTTDPPANTDNPDNQPGTNDELIVGQVQVSYQQSTGGVACMTLHHYVAPGQASTTFHNFDMDGNTRLRYYAPSDAYDATGVSLGTGSPTLSSDGHWNVSGTLTRGGDTIPNPEAGWWRIVSCLTANNQFIQEALPGRGGYFGQPPTPVLVIGKTDGTTVAPAGGDLTYVVTVTNTSSGPTAGAAHAVVVTDTIPANSTFGGCTIVAPATGSCSQSLGVVTATLGGWINAGDSADVEITVTVDPAATGTVSNNAAAGFEDVLGNPFPAVTASDVDSVGPPVPTPTPTPSPTPIPNPTPAQTPIASVPNTGVDGIRGEQGAASDLGALVGVLLVALLALGWLVVRRQRPSLPRWVR